MINCDHEIIRTGPPPYGGGAGGIGGGPGGFTQPHGPPPGSDPQCAVIQLYEVITFSCISLAGSGLGSLQLIQVILLSMSKCSILIICTDRSGAINAV